MPTGQPIAKSRIRAFLLNLAPIPYGLGYDYLGKESAGWVRQTVRFIFWLLTVPVALVIWLYVDVNGFGCDPDAFIGSCAPPRWAGPLSALLTLTFIPLLTSIDAFLIARPFGIREGLTGHGSVATGPAKPLHQALQSRRETGQRNYRYSRYEEATHDGQLPLRMITGQSAGGKQETLDTPRSSRTDGSDSDASDSLSGPERPGE